MELVVLWFVLCFFSLGILSFGYIFMKKSVKKPWDIKINQHYRPKVSILVPTYNEADIIRFKLLNLYKVNYPRELIQIIIVDSNSDDNTIGIVNNFINNYPDINVKIYVEKKRSGKSAALNSALKYCNGDIVIVSDADCFWPPDILRKSLPFLADSTVGAISGPKILVNPNKSWVTKSEATYLNSMNLVKLGESKVASTLFFEGGFAAYKRRALMSFDPYDTGSDDCGTVIHFIENGYRTILVPEARFYSAFPATWRGKFAIKLRRANQLVHVMWKYFCLLLNNCIKGSKRVVIQAIFLYLIEPIVFIALIVTTIILLLKFPYLALLFGVFLIPRVGIRLFEVVQSYFVLFLSILSSLFKKKFVVWSKPEDRAFLEEKTLRKYRLI